MQFVTSFITFICSMIHKVMHSRASPQPLHLTPFHHYVTKQYNLKADTWGVGRDGARRRTETCRWIGIGTKGRGEHQVSTRPSPSAAFVPASPLQQFKSSLHKLDPWEERIDQCTENYCHSRRLSPRSKRESEGGGQWIRNVLKKTNWPCRTDVPHFLSFPRVIGIAF